MRQRYYRHQTENQLQMQPIFENEEQSQTNSSSKLESINKKYQPKLVMLVVQISVCLLILGCATILKSFGGNYFEIVRQWYNEKINDSLIVEKSIKEYQSVIKEKFPKNAKFVNYNCKNLPEVALTVNLHEPLESGKITSRFGKRNDPITGKESLHHGLDIGANGGTPIHAVLAGTVKRAERIGGYGNCVILDHGNNIKTLYAHCKRLDVQPGDIVKRGQKVAHVGSSGRSTGDHLHFELVVNEEKINPEKFFNSIYV